MRTRETRTETLQGAAAESWFGMHSVQAQKIVIDVLNDRTLKKSSVICWLSGTARPTFETTSRSAERSRENQTPIHRCSSVCKHVPECSIRRRSKLQCSTRSEIMKIRMESVRRSAGAICFFCAADCRRAGKR